MNRKKKAVLRQEADAAMQAGSKSLPAVQTHSSLGAFELGRYSGLGGSRDCK